MLANLGAALNLLSLETLTVSRPSPQTFVEGRVVDNAATTFQIRASFQPSGGRDVKDLPEGLRADESRVLFTATELRGADFHDQLCDVVTGDGCDWSVHKVERWGAIAGYFKVTLVREPQ